MKKAIILGIVILGILAGTSVLQAELLFHWKLDDAASSTMVSDATGHGYYGECIGTPAFAQAGQNGTSVYFDPSDGKDYLTLPFIPELATQSFSLSLWMKLEDNSSAHQVPFSNGNFSPTWEKDGITAIQWGGTEDLTLRFGYNSSSWTEYRAVGTSQLNTWHHIVITADCFFDVSNYNTLYDYRVVRRYYLDGVLVDENLNDFYMPNRHDRPFTIGVRQMGASTDPAYPCKGYFDDVQYYTHALNPGTVAYMYAHPGTTGEIELIPDDFEVYADTTELGSYWTATGGAVSLETTEFQAGSQALKAQMTAAGTVTKTGAYISSFKEKTPYDFSLWYKGIAGNPAGALTVTVKDSLNAVVKQSVVAGATQTADWTQLRISMGNDPNAWQDVKTVELQIGSAATMYFDTIGFERPVSAPYRILQWKFDESSGLSAGDSTVYGNNGALGSWFTGSQWVINGGRSGDTGDNALSFTGAGNNADAEVISGTISPDLSGDTDWAITMWVYLNSASPGSDIILGGLGDVWSAPTTGDLSQRYIIINSDTLQPRLLYGYETSWSLSSSWGQALTTGQWYMLTVTNDSWGDAMDFYINADRVNGMVWNAVVDASVAAMSPDVNGLATFTAPDGKVDDFSIWAGRLTQADIAVLAGGWTCLNPPLYDFNDDCATDLLDFAEFAAHWLECGRFPSSYCSN